MPYFEHAGCQLYYEDHGQGEPLLLVHGLGSSIQDWEYQLPHLQQQRRVVAVDLRGHGRSGKPRERYSMAAFAADVAALIEHLGLPPVHLVGISMGGMVGFQLGVDRPELLRSLCIVNSAPELKAKSAADWWMLAKRWSLSRLLSLQTIGKGLGRLLFPCRSRPSCAPRSNNAGRRTTSAPTSPASTPSSAGACVNAWPPSPVLPW